MEDFAHEQINYEQNTGMLLHVGGYTDIYTSNHWHNGFEIIYVTDGEMNVSFKENEYILKPGGFAVINCKTIHASWNKEYCRYLLLQIPYNTIKKNIPDIDSVVIRCICQSAEKVSGKLIPVKETLEKLESLYCSEHDSGYLLKLNSLVYELLYYLVIDFKTEINLKIKKKTEKNVQRLGVVLQYVRQHYAENISLADAADMVALNREYFSRFFKKYMGQTFMEYLFSVRLESAYYDILNTDYTISEIASRCGFESSHRTFVNEFRKRYGCKPSEKRKQIGNI